MILDCIMSKNLFWGSNLLKNYNLTSENFERLIQVFVFCLFIGFLKRQKCFTFNFVEWYDYENALHLFIRTRRFSWIVFPVKENFEDSMEDKFLHAPLEGGGNGRTLLLRFMNCRGEADKAKEMGIQKSRGGSHLLLSLSVWP